uniref:ShKT domain-containing protein n=1 Tax=Acrobeloides nanus TaxID=290746 RepID=A0A914C083_9BILA
MPGLCSLSSSEVPKGGQVRPPLPEKLPRRVRESENSPGDVKPPRRVRNPKILRMMFDHHSTAITTQAPSSCVNRYSNCDDFINDCTTDPTMPVDCPITCDTCQG